MITTTSECWFCLTSDIIIIIILDRHTHQWAVILCTHNLCHGARLSIYAHIRTIHTPHQWGSLPQPLNAPLAYHYLLCLLLFSGQSHVEDILPALSLLYSQLQPGLCLLQSGHLVCSSCLQEREEMVNVCLLLLPPVVCVCVCVCVSVCVCVCV